MFLICFSVDVGDHAHVQGAAPGHQDVEGQGRQSDAGQGREVGGQGVDRLQEGIFLIYIIYL